MRQKLQDLQTLLLKDRKTQVIGLVVVFAALFLLLSESGPSKPRQKRPDLPEGVGVTNPNERYEDLVSALRGDLVDLQQQVHQTDARMTDFMNRTEENEKRTVEILRRLLERVTDAENAAMSVNMSSRNGGGVIDVDDPNAPGGAGRARRGPGFEGEGEGELAPDELQPWGDMQDVTSPPPPQPPAKLAMVGTGDSVRVQLLSGLNAATDGTPYPVIFKLLDDVVGPDGSALPLGEARIMAAAQGSLTDSRALFRLSSINIRLPNGRRKVLPVDGFVVGEDGMLGMPGRLIDPIGKSIIGGAIAGGLDGIGRAVSDSQVTRVSGPFGQSEEFVTGSEAEYAGGLAISGAAQEWRDIIRDRAEQLVPHVEVLSGRQGTAVFSKSFIIEDLMEMLEEEESFTG